ncbi:UDP-GlcNAc:betaGal beta-1,3-N-acetylglucosaminyltransferase 6 [Stylophora pistillata]|uniref:UDP-GlcNAc:betaGal beta-1,3-N-acetylglucosaminyltransferase 6 n=1 Tax=Stylophora pistillata TaxID=50429 RepID=A0A2B4RTG8_STYPI|nr:UDP-GlcNAc:betaGal beta-1,3-N-acetylglucosaminyltransferase 6 [Stylophora pistillata]
MELKRHAVTLIRGFQRLLSLAIRSLRRCLPSVSICFLLLVVLSLWLTLKNINHKVTLLSSSSVLREPKTNAFNFLEKDFYSQHQILRTKLRTTAACPPKSILLLILVSSNVGNFDRRQLIRKTWGADHSIETKWKTVFLMGKNSNEREMENATDEARIFGDIVQGDYQEHFWNMSYKVAMGFEWAVKYCNFYYVLKADDDVFVNTLGLVDFLAKHTTPLSKFYTGNIMVGSPVLRNGRYGVSPEEYNETVYKPYCSGGGYVLSRDVVEKLLRYFDVLEPLKIDDAYIGILAAKAGVKVTHNEEFRMYEDKCEYKETTLVQHPARGDCAIMLYHRMIGRKSKMHRNEKCLPLALICLLLLVAWTSWMTLNNINEKVILMASSFVYGDSESIFLQRNETVNSLDGEVYSQNPKLRTKLLTTATCPADPLLFLILVSSNVGNFDRRQLIRKTWGADHSIETRWKTVFLVGKNGNQKVMENASVESGIYGDIVQGDYQEHFWNMSFKVAMGFEWAVKHCTFYYLLKGDDDVFVNTLGMVEFLTKQTTPISKLYTGHIMVGSPVLRNGRYGVTPEEYGDTVYKPYCSGGGYILSRDVVETFLSYYDVSKPLKIDDAYIGILARKAEVKVIHNKEFRMYADRCEYRETTLVQHPARGDCAIMLYHRMIGWKSNMYRNG